MTASADMQRLITDVVVKFPGALKSDVQAKLFNVINEFLEFTNVWYENIDVVLAVHTLVYNIAPTENPAGRMVRLLVLYDSQDVRLPYLYWVDRARFILPSTIQIFTAPSTVKTWVARMAKIIATVDADGNPALPDWVIQRYRDQIMAGVHREYYLEANKPWSNPTLAAHWGKQFLAHKSTARVDGIKGNVMGQTNWVFPSGGGRGSQRGA